MFWGAFAAALFAWGSFVGCGGGLTDTESTGGVDGGAGGPIILDGGGELPAPPDGEKLCPAGACNYQTSAGCSGSTPSCLPSFGAGDAVVPSCQAAGAGASGASCAAWTDCAPGFLCAEGACRKLCCGGDWTGCPSAGEHCIRALELKSGSGQIVSSGAMLCYPVNTCDALAPASCAEPGTTCQIVDPTGATACFPEGTGESGQPCPCKGGFLCVAGECRRLCKAAPGGGEPSCKSDEGVCVHFNRDPPGVGECTQF
jgi:hypothetical protein